jgi:hypothetical protein
LSRTQPEKLDFLRGVGPDLFWSAVYDRPFRLFGIRDPYLVPEDAPNIPPDAQMENIHEFFAEPLEEKNALAQGRAMVLDVSGEVRDITAEYRMPAQIQ